MWPCIISTVRISGVRKWDKLTLLVDRYRYKMQRTITLLNLATRSTTKIFMNHITHTWDIDQYIQERYLDCDVRCIMFGE